jgi:hypothetical protein
LRHGLTQRRTENEAKFVVLALKLVICQSIVASDLKPLLSGKQKIFRNCEEVSIWLCRFSQLGTPLCRRSVVAVKLDIGPWLPPACLVARLPAGLALAGSGYG